MKVAIVTPLYPPDIADPAPYAKELATRLAKDHVVTVLTYAYLPEKVSGVSVVSINKRRPLIIRLIYCTRALWKAAHENDVIYAENGASVELPVGIVAFFSRTPCVFHIGDALAHERALAQYRLRLIEQFVQHRAAAVITESPLRRPIITPFAPRTESEWSNYEASWQAHLARLESTFHHVTQR